MPSDFFYLPVYLPLSLPVFAHISVLSLTDFIKKTGNILCTFLPEYEYDTYWQTK